MASCERLGVPGGAAALGLLALLVPAFAGAPAAAEPLALKRVVLSSGGVGYFEHEATVEGGDAGLELPVRLDQVADVLKSLVVVDEGGAGARATVRLPGRQPLPQVFRDLPFGADALDSLVALLHALKGAEIEVTAPRRVEGRLLGVTPETIRLGGGGGDPATTTRHRVSVLTGAGVQQFILEEAEAIAFADPGLQAQVDAALAAVAAHRAQDQRVLTIDVEGGTAGAGGAPRTVRVGYVVGVPLWKTSYRLTLPPAEDGDDGGDTAGADGAAARLQGWAVVENMSGRDWDGVELTLVSGNPVTFRQDLYSAYYVDRPEVPVEVLGRVLPRPDVGAVAAAPAAQAAAPAAPARQELRRRAMLDEAAGRAPAETEAAADLAMAKPAGRGVGVGGGFAAAEAAPFAAAAEEAATQVVFRFPDPVGVESGHSLMLPVIDRDVPASRLALYQPETNADHPLAAVRLTNDAGTGLPPGVLTLYERTAAAEAGSAGRDDGEGGAGGGGGTAAATTYVGDARLGVLPAGEERLVSFALDQKTRVDREEQSRQRIAKGKVNRGILELTVLDERTTVYRLKAPAQEGRLVLLEHPRHPGWELARPAAADVELTPTHYRVPHRLQAGEEDRVEVVERRPRVERLELLALGTDQLALYARTGGLDAPLRKAFARMGELRAEIDRGARRLDEVEAARRRLFEEQQRIRDNLARIPPNSDLHRRYLDKLDAQEDELERLGAELESAQDELERAREALSSYVAGLEL